MLFITVSAKTAQSVCVCACARVHVCARVRACACSEIMSVLLLGLETDRQTCGVVISSEK
jgi:hypothetical protein